MQLCRLPRRRPIVLSGKCDAPPSKRASHLAFGAWHVGRRKSRGLGTQVRRTHEEEGEKGNAAARLAGKCDAPPSKRASHLAFGAWHLG